MEHGAYVRTPDVVWRVTTDRVIVLRVGDRDAADLTGGAALVWVAAETPISPREIGLDTGLDEGVVDAAIESLLEHGWLVPG